MDPGCDKALERERAQYRQALQDLRLPAFHCSPGGPFLLALEGPNAAGKTTLWRRLADALPAPACLGTDPAWLAEPFKTRMIRDADWDASALFFLSGCLEQTRLLRQRPEPLVILDRSLWSTLAVHAAEDPGRLAILLAVLAPLADRIRVPDLTLVLEASFATCQARIARKTGADRALDELTANPAFHAREQEFYRWLGRRLPTVRFLDVDLAAPEAVAAQALALISETALTHPETPHPVSPQTQASRSVTEERC